MCLMQNPSRGGGYSGRSRGGRKGAPRPQPYNRNKFLQANFRFLVSDAADLRRHEADADLMLDWDDIVQVLVTVSRIALQWYGGLSIVICNKNRKFLPFCWSPVQVAVSQSLTEQY